MKKLLLALATIILATLPLVGCTSERIASATKPTVVTLTDVSGYPFCTGVAVGKHLVWTKAHCMVMPEIFYNGTSCPTDVVVVDDKHDNVLVRTCQSYSHVAKLARQAPKVGEVVYFWGHFARLPMLFRVGHVSGIDTLFPRYEIEDNGTIYTFDFQATGGDSGGPIFNYRGEVVCTLTGGFAEKLPYCSPHYFTQDQLKGKF